MPQTSTGRASSGSCSTENGPPSFAVAPAVIDQETSACGPKTAGGSSSVAAVAGFHHSAAAGFGGASAAMVQSTGAQKSASRGGILMGGDFADGWPLDTGFKFRPRASHFARTPAPP